MKKLLLILLITGPICLLGQESPSRWQAGLSLGQYSASLFVPRFEPIHPGAQAGLTYTWNKHPRHRFTQSANLAFVNHGLVHNLIQVFTELGYGIHLENGLNIRPFTIGGGYSLGIADMQSFIWDTETNSYQSTTDFHHNWMITLGAGLGYRTNLQLFNQPLTFTLDYRILVQGTFIRVNAPLIAYAPLRVGVALPVNFAKK